MSSHVLFMPDLVHFPRLRLFQSLSDHLESSWQKLIERAVKIKRHLQASHALKRSRKNFTNRELNMHIELLHYA